MPKAKLKQLNKIKTDVVKILKKHGIKKAGIFGSYARGEEKRDSDIDILVQAKKGFSLLDLVGLELELKKSLKKDVDLLTYNGIAPALKKRILKEEVKML